MNPSDDHPHVPGPSLWPVGLAVGVVVLLVGLIISWWVAAVGAVVALAFGALWVRDLTADTELAEAQTVEPERKAPAVSDEHVLAPPAEERYGRNRFLEVSTLGVGALIGGILTAPALGFMVAPAFLKQGEKDQDLGPMSNFPEGTYVVTTFTAVPSQGQVSRRTAYIRNNGQLNGQPSFTIISNHCAHLGCPVQPNGPLDPKGTRKFADVTIVPTISIAGFGCPCHGGQYDTEGNRTAGPPVRALDRWSFDIVNGRLILLSTYSVSHVVGTGAQARIYKYKSAGPGEHVDGPEEWFYPLNPPHH